MKLMNKEIEARLQPLYSTDGQGDQATVAVKYYIPDGNGGDYMHWVITEGEKQEDGDWLLFGLCEIYCREWGYVLLSELEGISVDRPNGLVGINVQYVLYDNKTVAEVAGPDPWSRHGYEITEDMEER